MVVELFAVALAYFIGWAYLRPVFYTFGWVLTAALAFPIGIAIWGLTAALGILLPVRYDAGLITVVCILGVLIFNWQKCSSPRAHEVVAFFSGLFVLLSCAGIFVYLDATGITTDSMFVLSVGKQLVEQGGPTDTMKGVLASFAIYLSLMESAALSLNLEYFRSLLPLCLISTMILFLLFGLRALDVNEKRTCFFNTLLVVLGIAVLASTYAFLWHGFYLKATPVCTLFLFICCSTTFFAERDSDARWLHAMVPVALGTMLLRMEAGLTIMPMLVVLTAAPNIPIKSRVKSLITFSLAILFWYSFLLIRSFGHGLFSVYELAAIGSLPAIFLATVLILLFITKDREKLVFDQLLKLMPSLMCAVLATFVIVYTATRPESALSSLEALYCFVSGADAGVFYFWGGVFILLIFTPFVTQQTDACWIFGVNATGFILIILAITVMVPTKHCGVTDSINRILTQIMPVLMFYLVLRYGTKSNFQSSRRRSAE